MSCKKGALEYVREMIWDVELSRVYSSSGVLKTSISSHLGKEQEVIYSNMNNFVTSNIAVRRLYGSCLTSVMTTHSAFVPNC